MSVLTALRVIREKQTTRMLKAMRVANAMMKAKSQTSLKGSMRLNTPFRLKAHATPNGNRPFAGVAYTGGVFYPTMTIGGRNETGATVLDLDTLTIPSPDRPVLDDHDERPEGIIGKTTMIAVRKPQYDLPVNGVIYGSNERSQKFISRAADGHKWQLSVGTDNFTIERIAAGKSVRVNGKVFDGPVTVARNAYLTDVSFVVVGADDRTSAFIAARRAKQPKLGTRKVMT